jgi:elongation factor Ts
MRARQRVPGSAPFLLITYHKARKGGKESFVEISATMVKELRQQTGAGVMDCRKALETADGDMAKAAELLREKALAVADKKADRATLEGMIGSYIHMGSKVAAMVELNCESDFVARTEQFQGLARDLAMQVVATRPGWVSVEDVPAEVVAEQRQNALDGVDANKSPEVVEKIVQGKLAKFYEENCLLEQPFIKDDSVKVKDLVRAYIGQLGENIIVRRFSRLEVGG